MPRVPNAPAPYIQLSYSLQYFIIHSTLQQVVARSNNREVTKRHMRMRGICLSIWEVSEKYLVSIEEVTYANK